MFFCLKNGIAIHIEATRTPSPMEGRLYQISCSGCFFGAEQVNKCDEKATKLKDEDKHKYKNGRSLTLLVVPRKDCTDCNRIQSA